MSESDFGENIFCISNASEEMSRKPRNFGTPVRKRKKFIEDEGNDSNTLSICRICHQNILDPKTKLFQGLPDEGLEEEAALTDDRLQLYCDGSFIPEIDIKPMHKITHFSVFDGEGHLCPFDTGLIENDQYIFFSGYIKPIYDDDSSFNNGVPAQELGPIVEWWIAGYDGGNSFLIALRSPYAEYILMEPSPEYRPFMRIPKQKALLAKIVIEFLDCANKPTYEELVSRINEVSVPPDTEPFDGQSLKKHAQFIVDQVIEVDCNKKLFSTPAIQDIIKKFQVSVKKIGSEKKKSRFKSIFNVTTTSLVRRHFKFFLEENNYNPTSHPVELLNNKITSEPLLSNKLSKFTWEENSNFAIVNDEVICIKDFVIINANQPDKSNRIFRVERFFQQNFTKQVHCTEYIRGVDTVLGNASNPQEIFFLEKCSDWPICKILKKINVNIKNMKSSWREWFDHPAESVETDLFLSKKYSLIHGSFECFEEIQGSECSVCLMNSQKESEIVCAEGETDVDGTTFYNLITWKNEEYFPGCSVFLEPFSVTFDSQKSSQKIEINLVTVKANELIYPEIYRKSKDANVIEECSEPFVVGRIKNIFSSKVNSKKKFFITINKFYRPENTRVIETGDERLSDMRLLYWSKEEAVVGLDNVRGRCDVVYSEQPLQINLDNRFYYNSEFDFESKTFYSAEDVIVVGKERKPKFVKKLKTLNAFSGCGGLAEGLQQSGVAEIVWAVEIDQITSKSFKRNFRNVTMFEKDCNYFLREVLAGKLADEDGNRYPLRGEVEFLCGGPPCQGFSIMNRFTTKEESRYNNALILTFLSICDYYRPKFFLMENVKNFISFKKSIFFRHALSCLIAMGYQCSFGVLQAGHYGLPQNRKRLFILAAAPGFRLPPFPKPTNVFFDCLKNSGCEIGTASYTLRFSKAVSGSAPFRKVTVRDAIFDLRKLSINSNEQIADSGQTFFQNFLMGIPSQICDHVTKEISPLNEARIKHIPAAKGCDWRDLPNIQVRLRDGTLTDFLKYSYHDYKNGKSLCGSLRGVCSCASGGPCNARDRQMNTLIPWFLVHTANRNNNWTGLYGRLNWQGVFNTVTTNPEPSNQQGKVLHPEEDRIVSVRECARAQGLPDSFKLYGSVAEKFKQIGNAVPPPIARAIGLEMFKSLSQDSEILSFSRI